MVFYVDRGAVINNIIAKLQTVSNFNLVKAYEGEFYRFYLKGQIQAETFPAEVNLQTPFALVSSRSRPVQTQGQVMTLKHELSVLVGMGNTHDFSQTAASGIFVLLDAAAAALVGSKFHEHAGKIALENHGVFLAKTDLFTVYEQQLYQLEKAST